MLQRNHSNLPNCSIATMTQNSSDDPACKTTLIGASKARNSIRSFAYPTHIVVAPLALLEQWKLEIETKTDGFPFKVLIYHGSNKPTTKKALGKYDVILTTFHTLANEYPNYEKLDKERKLRGDDFVSDDEETKPKRRTKPGLLMEFEWYRVRKLTLCS